MYNKLINKKIGLLIVLCVLFQFVTEGHLASKSNWVKIKNSPFLNWLQKSAKRYSIPSIIVAKLDESNNIKYYSIKTDMDRSYNLASLTKTFTAIAILQLAQDNKLKLDDPILDHLPTTVIHSRYSIFKIKIKHLMLHTSGIQAGSNGVYYQYYDSGYKFKYSNSGFVLLKKIIENVTNESYGNYVKDNIFLPLNMVSSDASESNGTSGITTNILDLSNYARMLLNKGEYNGHIILEESYFNLMFAKIPGTKKNSFGSYYYWSLGWEVFLNKDKKIDSYHKAGRYREGACGIMVYPNDQTAYVYLSNTKNSLQKIYLKWRHLFMTKFEENFIEGKYKMLPKYQML